MAQDRVEVWRSHAMEVLLGVLYHTITWMWCLAGSVQVPVSNDIQQLVQNSASQQQGGHSC
jgi:hypothetical protein